MVKAPVGRPRFLRYWYVTLILFSIHIQLFTVFWYMPSSNASCGSVKSAVGAPHLFKILCLALAKTSFLTKHVFRKLHLMPIRVLLSSFFHSCLSSTGYRHRMHFTWTLTFPPPPHVCNVASTPYALHMSVNMPTPPHVCNVASTPYALHMNVNMPTPPHVCNVASCPCMKVTTVRSLKGRRHQIKKMHVCIYI